MRLSSWTSPRRDRREHLILNRRMFNNEDCSDLGVEPENFIYLRSKKEQLEIVDTVDIFSI